MESSEIVAATSALCCLTYYNYLVVYHTKKIRKPWKKRRWWMKAINRNRTKLTMENMYNELICEPSGEFDNFCRMSLTDFEYLLCKISPIISKEDTHFREAIPAKLRLTITLRFLASGDSYQSLHFLFKVSSAIISKIVPEICAAINEVLKNEIKMPSTPNECIEIEKGFSQKFPHCVGALDGKHIVMRSPAHSGTEYYNYKNNFSIVLLAMTCVLLHNFLRRRSESRYNPPGTFDIYNKNGILVQPGSWRKVTQDSSAIKPLIKIPRKPSLNAQQIRQEFSVYFSKNSV